MQHAAFSKGALPVQYIDIFSSGDDVVVLVWVDLALRPDLVELAQKHPGGSGFAECRRSAPNLRDRHALFYLHLQAHAPTTHAFILALPVAAFYTQLQQIALGRFIWVMGGPRPDYLVEEHRDDPADLALRLIAARGQGIQLELHPDLAARLEALLRAIARGTGTNELIAQSYLDEEGNAMHKQFERVVVVSVRTTCWEKGERPEDEEHEIIEIGTCFLDISTLEISEKESFIFKPVRSKVSAFCTTLTTLTQDQVEAEGVAFPQFCLRFRHSRMDEYTWASFGEDHRLLLQRECQVRQAPFPLNALHLNVRLLATFHLQLIQAPSMARTLELLGLPPLDGRRAGDSAWNTARVLAFFLSRLRSVPGGSGEYAP